MSQLPSALTDVPTNKNFLSPLNFTFRLKRAPHVNFFIQKINLPSLSVGPVDIPNPFDRIPWSGEHLTYGNLDIVFKVDEDLENYLEIYNWINALSKPESYQQYADIKAQPSYSGNGVFSDIDLLVLTSAKNPNYRVTYVDAFPISLGALEFDTTNTDVNYLAVPVTFRYLSYSVKKIS